MSYINAIIIDDERPARKELIYLLKDFPNVSVIAEADNIKDAIELIERCKPDIIFLDIQLSGENGFDLLKKVNIDFKIVFVTAYDEYAIKAFEVNASDYLLKPIDPIRLEQSLKRILEKKEPSKPEIKKFDYNDSIYVKLNNCTAQFVEIKSIIAITSVGNYTKLQSTDGNSYLVLKTLKRWEDELSEAFFVRIHRSTIVNIKYIQKVNSYSKTHYQVYMKQIEAPFEVSRNCYKNLRKLNN